MSFLLVDNLIYTMTDDFRECQAELNNSYFGQSLPKGLYIYNLKQIMEQDMVVVQKVSDAQICDFINYNNDI